MRAVLACICLAALPVGVKAQSLLPDGLWSCSTFLGSTFIHAGYLETHGTQYRGPSLEEVSTAEWSAYKMDAAGLLQLGGGFGAYSSDGNIITAAEAGPDTDGTFILSVEVLTPGLNALVLSCRPE